MSLPFMQLSICFASLFCLVNSFDGPLGTMSNQLNKVHDLSDLQHYAEQLANKKSELDELLKERIASKCTVEDKHVSDMVEKINNVYPRANVTATFCDESVLENLENAIEEPSEYFEGLKRRLGTDTAECLKNLFQAKLEDHNLSKTKADCKKRLMEDSGAKNITSFLYDTIIVILAAEDE